MPAVAAVTQSVTVSYPISWADLAPYYYTTTTASTGNFSTWTTDTAPVTTLVSSGYTSAGTVTPFDLTAPSQLLMPVYTPLRAGVQTVDEVRYSYGVAPAPERTQEQEAEAARLRETELAVRRTAQEARLAIRQRANDLLISWLSPQQRADYRDRGWFEVRGNLGTRWRINADGQSGNVHRLDSAGEWESTWCAHPAGYLPDPDAWLAQMLALETDEAGWVAIANCHRRREPLRLMAA